ncbi:shikimate kinase [Chlamydiifrater phoenicopteri]|uniref:shikimate kinase n=1 Tax=Chlamydiifrater phoenicopteri TaxID=2681469 RepID=UPI001BD17BBA|nr:shikimate kinase [Chlamydiifrater phoenicopteri]
MFVICGLPRIGKTSLGRQLSKKLCLPLVDLDLCCENTYLYIYKKAFSCTQIVQTHQELFFRELETFCLTLVGQHYQPSVISLGGGTLTHAQSIPLVKNLGTLIHIEIPFREYLATNSRRLPETLRNSPSNELESHLKSRNFLFKRLADITFSYDLSLSPRENSENLINILKKNSLLRTFPDTLPTSALATNV